MLRKLVFLGIFVGSAASVPILYQQNPEGFEAAVRSTFEREKEKEEQETPTVVVSRAEVERETEVLTGRKVRVPTDKRGHYFADFKLNGYPVNAMVDTGATLVALNETAARRIGINLSQADFRYRVTTANGEAKAAATKLESIQIGRIYLEGVDAVVLDDDALDQTLIGLSFLNRLSRFEVGNGSMLMEQ